MSEEDPTETDESPLLKETPITDPKPSPANTSEVKPAAQSQKPLSPNRALSTAPGSSRAEAGNSKQTVSASPGRGKTAQGSSVTVDRVIDLVARGRPLHDGPSWKRPRNYAIDPSLKAVRQQMAQDQKAGPSQLHGQPIRQNQTSRLPAPQAYRVNLSKDRHGSQNTGPTHVRPPSETGPSAQEFAYEAPAAPPKQKPQQSTLPSRPLPTGNPSTQAGPLQARPPHRPVQAANPSSQAGPLIAIAGPSRQGSSQSGPKPPAGPVSQGGPSGSRPQASHRQTPSAKSSSGGPLKPGTNMRPVQIVATPRGLLPVPPGTKHTSSPDDHKFKKPLLPAKLRKQVDEEKRRKEAFEDAQRVQRHMQEAKRAAQEAERTRPPRSGSSRNKNLVPIPILFPPPSPEITEEMIQQSDKEMQKVCFNQEIFDIHNVLLHSSFLLRQVCSKKNFQSLSQESQDHLKKFLPSDAGENMTIYLNMAFSNVHMAGRANPIHNLHLRLKNGHFNAERINDLIHIRDTEKIMYDHYIRMYHMRMFRKLVVSRHLILEQYDNVGIENIRRPGPHPRAKDNIAEKRLVRSLKRRAAKRSRMITTDCRQRAGEQGISSDDEGEDIGEPIHKSLQIATCPRSTIYNPRVKDLDMWQPLKIGDVKSMLKKYKRYKRTHKKAPSMNFKNIKLDHVFDRAGILAQSQKIKETVAALEKDLNRPHDPHSRKLFQ